MNSSIIGGPCARNIQWFVRCLFIKNGWLPLMVLFHWQGGPLGVVAETRLVSWAILEVFRLLSRGGCRNRAKWSNNLALIKFVHVISTHLNASFGRHMLQPMWFEGPTHTIHWVDQDVLPGLYHLDIHLGLTSAVRVDWPVRGGAVREAGCVSCFLDYGTFFSI